jgi:hypothetical protein
MEGDGCDNVYQVSSGLARCDGGQLTIATVRAETDTAAARPRPRLKSHTAWPVLSATRTSFKSVTPLRNVADDVLLVQLGN